MHRIRSHRLLYAQVPQVVLNLVFRYSGKGFAPLVPILQCINLGGARREVAGESKAKKLSTSAFSPSVDTRLPFLLVRGDTLSLTFLCWLTYL